MEIVPFPREEWMILHMEYNVQIAGGPAELSNLAASGEANPCSVLDSRRNFRIHRALS